MGREDEGYRIAAGAPGSDRRLGLAGVEPGFEVAADLLSVREDELVALAARRKLHEPDVVVTFPVAAQIRCGLVERSQTVALLPPEHSGRDTYQMGGRKESRRLVRSRTLRDLRIAA